MSAVPLKDLLEALHWLGGNYSDIADRIEQHGIAPPDGMVLVPKKTTKAMRRAAEKSCWYDKANDRLFPEAVYAAMLGAVDGKFIEQADEETHRRVDEAVRDGRIVDKRFRGGFVSVPVEPTQEMIDAGIMFGTSPTKVSIIWSNMLAAAPEVSE